MKAITQKVENWIETYFSDEYSELIKHVPRASIILFAENSKGKEDVIREATKQAILSLYSKAGEFERSALYDQVVSFKAKLDQLYFSERKVFREYTLPIDSLG